MKEIKFRAWDKTANKMSYVFGLQSIENAGLGEGAFIKQNVKGFFYLGWCDVMQYTGLKDKNGKDIYEGDLFGSPEMLRCVVERELDGSYVLRFLHPKMKGKKISI